MNKNSRRLQAELHSHLSRLRSVADAAAESARALNDLALNLETERPDLIPEGSLAREIATLLQHAVLNLARRVGDGPAGRSPSASAPATEETPPQALAPHAEVPGPEPLSDPKQPKPKTAKRPAPERLNPLERLQRELLAAGSLTMEPSARSTLEATFRSRAPG